MKRFLKYYKGHKGMAIVWIALLLFVLLVFAATAIDIGYMYYVKNQLQVAADASALAGVKMGLSGKYTGDPAVLQQNKARCEAWKFAQKNNAAGSPVYLVTNSPNYPADCNNANISHTGLNEANDVNGDIVVGNWDSSRANSPVDLRFRPTPGNLLQLEDVINAIKTRPQRTDESASYEMPKARVFLGQVFRYIGINWGYLAARAEAIASYKPATFVPLPICVETCINLPQTPLTGTPYPGHKITIQPPSTSEYIAWSDLQPIPGNPKSKRAQEDDPPGLQELIGIEKVGGNWIVKEPEPPEDDFCNESDCLRTQQGISNELTAFPEIIAARGKTYPLKGYSVFGWKTLIPVFEPCCPEGPPSEYACPGDQACGYRLVQVAEIIVTGVELPAGSGDPGIYIVGTDVDPNTTDPDKTKIKCVPCDDPGSDYFEPKLVK